MKCVGFHLQLEPVASQDADSHRGSSASLFGARHMGSVPVRGARHGDVT